VFAGESYDAVIAAAIAAYVGEDDGGASIAQRLRVREAGAILCRSFGECVDTHEHGQAVDYDGVSGGVDFAENGAIHGSAFARYLFSAKNVPVVDAEALDVAP
jgi:branched-chain amino acid transport system substrate-binding protein